MNKEERIRRIKQSGLLPEKAVDLYIEQLELELKQSMIVHEEILHKRLENALVENQLITVMLESAKKGII